MRGRQSSRKADPLGPTISLKQKKPWRLDDDDDDVNDANVTEPVEQCPDLNIIQHDWILFIGWRCNTKSLLISSFLGWSHISFSFCFKNTFYLFSYVAPFPDWDTFPHLDLLIEISAVWHCGISYTTDCILYQFVFPFCFNNKGGCMKGRLKPRCWNLESDAWDVSRVLKKTNLWQSDDCQVNCATRWPCIHLAILEPWH